MKNWLNKTVMSPWYGAYVYAVWYMHMLLGAVLIHSFNLFGSPHISLDLENINYKIGSGEEAEKETRGRMISRLPHYHDEELQI